MDAEQALSLTSHAAPIDFDEKPPQSQRPPLPKNDAILAGFIMWTLVSMVVAGAIIGYTTYASVDYDCICARYTSHASATLRSVAIHYEDRQFGGDFMHENMYRTNASSTVDEAWRALGIDLRPGVIPAEYGLESGLTDAHVQVADKYGGGFVVNVEGMHHLHCLDLLRQGLWFNFHHYHRLHRDAFKNDRHILQLHMTHCLDTLRQVLMCNVDTGVLGQVWVADQRGGAQAFPDFRTTHRCKNYEDVRAFAESIQAPPPDELPDDYLKSPKGDQVLPFTP